MQKNYILGTETDYHCMNNYGEIIGPLLTFSIKRAIICEFFVANPLDSRVVLY